MTPPVDFVFLLLAQESPSKLGSPFARSSVVRHTVKLSCLFVKKIPGFAAEDNFSIGKVSRSRGISS